MHAVFHIGPDSKYGKDFWQRYDIPTRTGAKTALLCLDDWVVFRETKSKGYFAVGRVKDVIKDPTRIGFALALIHDYLPFTSVVPFKYVGRYAEQVCRHVARPVHVGRLTHGQPVRELSPDDFNDIVLRGFPRTLKSLGESGIISDEPFGFREQAIAFDGFDSSPRPLRDLLVRRRFREANFRIEVCGRYGYRCAFTQLNLTDGRLFEVDAIHVLAVSLDGPDIVQNALSSMKTLHWAFDRHMLSLDQAYRPLVAPRSRIPEWLLAQFPPPGASILLPKDPRDYPSAVFLDKHRAAFRKKHGL